jgi:hypothetical protein
LYAIACKILFNARYFLNLSSFLSRSTQRCIGMDFFHNFAVNAYFLFCAQKNKRKIIVVNHVFSFPNSSRGLVPTCTWIRLQLEFKTMNKQKSIAYLLFSLIISSVVFLFETLITVKYQHLVSF